MDKEVGDLQSPATSQSFLLSPKSGCILSTMESPEFTELRRGEQSERKGQKGPYTLAHLAVPLTPGCWDLSKAWGFLKMHSPAEIRSQIPGVFSQLGSLIERTPAPRPWSSDQSSESPGYCPHPH